MWKLILYSLGNMIGECWGFIKGGGKNVWCLWERKY